MMSRKHLPDRRHSEILELELHGLRYTASFSCFADGGVAEVFLQNHKPGSQSDANARDAAVAASLALQFGCPLRDAAARGAARLHRSAVDAARRRNRCDYRSGGQQMNLASIHKVSALLPPRILIHGPEGVGKTTIASKFPSPIFLQTEDGCPGGLEINSFGPIESFADLRSAIGALASEPAPFSDRRARQPRRARRADLARRLPVARLVIDREPRLRKGIRRR